MSVPKVPEAVPETKAATTSSSLQILRDASSAAITAVTAHGVAIVTMANHLDQHVHPTMQDAFNEAAMEWVDIMENYVRINTLFDLLFNLHQRVTPTASTEEVAAAKLAMLAAMEAPTK